MEKRSESYWIRLTPEELADWRRRAAALSISVAELVRLRMRQGDDPEIVRLAPGGKSAVVISDGSLAEASGYQLGYSSRQTLANREDRPSRVSGGLGQVEVTPRFKASAKVRG